MVVSESFKVWVFLEPLGSKPSFFIMTNQTLSHVHWNEGLSLGNGGKQGEGSKKIKDFWGHIDVFQQC
jgi:hypothetical protein